MGPTEQQATQDFLFSGGPGHREHASSHQYLRQVTQARQKPVPQEGPQKSCNVGCVLHSFPPEGEAAKLYQPLPVAAQVLWSSSTLPCSFFVLSDRQASRGCHSPSACWDRRHRSQSIRQLPWEVRILDYGLIFFPPWRESGSWEFPPNCVAKSRGRDYEERVPVIFLLALMWLILHLPWLGARAS